MAAQSPMEEELNLYLSENGHLSFENPNYRLESLATIDPARLDDHLNSNIQPTIPVSVYEELCQEYDKNRRGRGSGGSSSCSSMDGSLTSRRKYASLDVGSMGVDVHRGPLTSLDNKLLDETQTLGSEVIEESCSKEGLESEIESEKLVESTTEKETKDKDIDETVVVRRRQKRQTIQSTLPPGWEKHSDEDGFYYWHIKSGTIQREIPQWDSEADQKNMCDVVRNVRSSTVFDENFDPALHASSMSKSCTASSIVELSKDRDLEQKRRSLPPAKADLSDDGSAKSIKVRVHSLGWIELSEDMLTSENSSKSVNRCIVQLSSNSASVESQGLWGGGKELLLELGDGSLRLIDADSGQLLNSQPIHTIRVWGVGRDNSRDFAYVARDKQTRKHLCHVFRCDTQARSLANALRDVCKKILIERSLAQSSSKIVGPISTSGNTTVEKKLSVATSRPAEVNNRRQSGGLPERIRPTNLGPSFNEKLKTRTVPAPESFPTPMEEPRKIMKARMLGTIVVNKPSGMDVLNDSINTLASEVPRDNWKMVSVAVAPSTITISFVDGGEAPLDCRVRFLSFLGISKQSVNYCAFIVHTAQDTFVSHVFYCEPNAGQLCKTIEAACKLRYQKCLDARQPTSGFNSNVPPNKTEGQNSRASIGATLKSMFIGSIGGRRSQGGPGGNLS